MLYIPKHTKCKSNFIRHIHNGFGFVLFRSVFCQHTLHRSLSMLTISQSKCVHISIQVDAQIYAVDGQVIKQMVEFKSSAMGDYETTISICIK